jgi:hypothetical protein
MLRLGHWFCLGYRLRLVDGQEFTEIDLLRVEVCDHPRSLFPLVDANTAADIAFTGRDL